MEVGERIKLRRKHLNLTQDELAKRVGYTSRSAIAKIESNANGMLQSKLILFAKALETTPAYLMGWEDDIDNQEDIKEYEKEDAITDIFKRLKEDTTFYEAVQKLYVLNKQQLEGVITMLSSFEQD